MEDFYLTSGEAAERLNLTNKALCQMRFLGNGPKYYKLGVGKQLKVLYLDRDLQDWLDIKSKTLA